MWNYGFCLWLSAKLHACKEFINEYTRIHIYYLVVEQASLEYFLIYQILIPNFFNVDKDMFFAD